MKYRIDRLDCPACAAKIENLVNNIPGVESASIDFLSRILHVNASGKGDLTDLIRTAVTSIEPDASIIPCTGCEAAEDILESNAKNDEQVLRPGIILPLALSLVLFGFLLYTQYSAKTSFWIMAGQAAGIFAWALSGAGVLKKAFLTLFRGRFFDENVLMAVATIGAIFIGAVSEAAGVMIFYGIGEMLQNLAVNHSKNAITALLATRPDTANLVEGETTRQVAAESLKPGDMIIVRSGERVCADGLVVSGRSFVDTAPLTGEPVPRAAEPGREVLAGMINTDGLLKVRVTKPFAESAISKMIALVESATAKKAKTERFITTFARYYTPAVVFCAAAIAIVPPFIFNFGKFSDWLYRGLILLVISCPCALMISIPLGYFGGIGRGAKMGILIKGAEFIDTLARLKTIVFDKTGTLTRGVFSVFRIEGANGFSENSVLEFAALAEAQSNHPIARSIIESAESINIDLSMQKNNAEYDEIPGKGVSAIIDGRKIMAGTRDFLLANKIDVPYDSEPSGTVVYVAADGLFAGRIHIGDELHPRAKEMVSRLRKMGVKTLMMLTGDNHGAAKAVADTLGLDGFSAGLLPDGKVGEFEAIMARKCRKKLFMVTKHAVSANNSSIISNICKRLIWKNNGCKVAFVGDGVNDAPVLARADVGMAMGALGSDAAVASADVVLMSDSPMRVADAVALSRRTRIIVWENIIFALAVKGIFIGLGVLGMASMWEAVFADVGTALLAVINSLRIFWSRR